MDQVTKAKVQFRREQRKQLIIECQQSGLPIRTCCTQHASVKSAFEMGLKVIIPEGTNTTFDNPYMDKGKTCKYYNEFMWSERFAECISVEATIQRMAEMKDKEL